MEPGYPLLYAAGYGGDMASIREALTQARLKPELHDAFVAASELTTAAELEHVDATDIVEVLIEIGCPKIKAKAVAGLLKAFASSPAAGSVGTGDVTSVTALSPPPTPGAAGGGVSASVDTEFSYAAPESMTASPPATTTKKGLDERFEEAEARPNSAHAAASDASSNELEIPPPVVTAELSIVDAPTSTVYLTPLNLHTKHAAKFDAAGYEMEEDLRDYVVEEGKTVDDLAAEFELPKPHARKLHKFLVGFAASAQEPAVANAAEADAESTAVAPEADAEAVAADAAAIPVVAPKAVVVIAADREPKAATAAAALTVVTGGGAVASKELASKAPSAVPAPMSAVRISGHTGRQSGKMGVYAWDAAHSLKRGQNVYSQERNSGVHLHRATNGVWHISPTEQMLSGEAAGWIWSLTSAPSPLGVEWDEGDTVVTAMSAAELAAERAAVEAEKERIVLAAEAEVQRAVAIVAVLVAGHTGDSIGEMGVYSRDEKHSPKREQNVYTLESQSGVHLYRANGGGWCVGDAEHMLAGKAAGAAIVSVTASLSPLDLEWMTSDDGAALRVDPKITVTEMSAEELTATRAAVEEALEAEAQQALTINALRVSGLIGEQITRMGVYVRDEVHSPKQGQNVFTLGSQSVHMYLALDGAWCIDDTANMIAGAGGGWIVSATAAPSPLGLEWKVSDGAPPHLHPRLAVVEVSAAELAAERTLAVASLRVFGLRGYTRGKHSRYMGVYARDDKYSPTRDANVYRLEGCLVSKVFMHRATDGAWCIAKKADMLAGTTSGWFKSATASDAASPALGLEWEYADGASSWCVDAQLVVVDAESEKQGELQMGAVRLAGHAGVQRGRMGVYARDARYSPQRGQNVYALEGKSRVFLYHATSGVWCVSNTSAMVAGTTVCMIMSTTASPSPLGLEWKVSDGATFLLDAEITVKENL